MASQGPKSREASSDLTELPTAVIAQAEAAASNEAERQFPIASDSTLHTTDPQSSRTLPHQKYVNSKAYFQSK